MHIYFRACEKQQAISNLARFQNVNKTDILKRCWSSIQRSVQDTDTIIVLHDEVSQSTLDWLRSTSSTSNITFTEVPPHDWEYHLHTVTLFDILTDKSKEFPDELHYIVEDDYLHTPNAIRVLEDTLKSWEHFAVSYDYPDRYTMNPQPARVMTGIDRHWRTIESCTMTVLAKGTTWLRHLDHIKTVASTSNDAIFTEIYKQESCISPLPGLSTHMMDYFMTPFVDWATIWNME